MTAWLPLILCTLALTPGPATGSAPAEPNVPAKYGTMLTEPLRRVRTTQPAVLDLLTEGMRRSPTFAGLVAALNATDVIVYIERVEKLAPNISGQLMLVPVANGQRYLRVQILGSLSPTDSIALIGHELRHALEVAAAPAVKDQKELIKLYERIGQRGIGLHAFDTIAAQDAGRVVRSELL